MKYFKQVSSIILVMVIWLTGCQGSGDKKQKVPVLTSTDDAYSISLKNDSTFKAIAENEDCVLLINGTTAEIAVKNKATDTIWYSNPQQRDNDTIAQGENKSLLYSQVSVTFSDSSDKFTTLYSYDDAVEYGQYHYAAIENGVIVTYEFGKREKEYLAPLLLETDKMERIFSQLASEDIDTLNSIYEYTDVSAIEDEYVRQQIIAVYPQLEKQPMYMLNNYTSEISEFIKETIQEILLQTDYTLEEMHSDVQRLDIKGITENAQNHINVTVEYTLTKDGLYVRIPYDDVVYDATAITLTNIAVLPAFGALENGTADAYVFVPDGSGALVYANGGNSNPESYYKQVYGYDRATELSSKSNEAQIMLPVFGAKKGKDAFLAIITEGDACAWLRAGCAGKNDNYVKAYADFAVTPYTKPTYSALNIWTINSYQSRRTESDICIEYHFLEEEEADYTGMANAFRSWLLKQKGTVTEAGQALYLSLLGAVEYPDSVAGITVRRKAALTTYEQAEKILSLLSENGVENINLVYEGATNEGLLSDPSKGAQPIRSLGGRKELQNLIVAAEKMSVALSLDGSPAYSVKKGWTKRVSQSINGHTAYLYQYNKHDTSQSKMWTDYFVVSPLQYASYDTTYRDTLAKLNIANSAYLTLGSDLNSNFNKATLTDRCQTKEIVCDILKNAGQNGTVTVSGGNAYALYSASAIINAPLDTPTDYQFDEVVPFYAIATRGVCGIAGEPMNGVADPEQALLKAVETGSNLYIRWMYAENSVLKSTYYDGVSLCYKPWLEWVCDYYKQLNNAVGDCAGETIIHHTKLQDNVYKTTFENGKKVYVNYGKESVTVEGVSIAARSWVAGK